jgi:vitamin B12 transporter
MPRRRSRAIAALVAALSATPIAAQDPDDAVVVTATRYPTRASRVLADVSVIQRPEIERAGASGIVDLLSRQPGVQITSNGGVGSSSAVFLRGANASQTVVLIDGVRVGSATTGAPALDAIPLGQVERIEILRGPASALYGADAVGGVIQIFTRRGRGAPAFNAFAGAGTQWTGEVDAGVSGTSGALAYSLGGGAFTTRGYSATDSVLTQPFAFNPDRDGYKNANGAGTVSYDFGSANQVGASALYSKGRNVFDNGPSSFDARLDKITQAYSGYWRSRFLEAWTSTVRLARGIDDVTSITSPTARSFFRTTQDQFTWQNDVELPFGRALAAYERREEKVDSTTAFTVDRRTIDSFLGGVTAELGAHQLQGNLRNDDNSQFGAKTTGLAAYGYRFTEQLRAHASYGTAFRAPSFNDLYFPASAFCNPCSNPNLVPEEARTWEAGLAWEPGVHRLAAVYYDSRITNLIVFNVAASEPQNVGRAELSGATLTYAGALPLWNVGASLDLLDARDEDTGKRLPRRAQWQSSLRALYRGERWQPGIEFVAAGARYDDPANTRRLDGYLVMNLTLRYVLARDWSIEARANNVTDTDYETARGFPMPGASAFIGVRYQQTR